MIVVADNLRITLPVIREAVERMDADPIREMAAACQAAGARAVDINSGPLSRDPHKMAFLVRGVQASIDLPLMLDTTNPTAMAAGLKACRKRPIVNGVSLEPDKLRRILPLAQAYDADLVCYLLRPDGHVPADAAGRMEAAVALFGKCEQAGIPAERLIIDPIVAPLAWQDGNRQNMDILDVIRTLPDLLGTPVRTMAGLSNLTTGAPDSATRHRYQSVFIPMLAAAGVDILLMNVLDPGLMSVVAVCRNISDRAIFSWR